MKKILFILIIIFPLGVIAQTADLDTLLKKKLISPAVYERLVRDRLFAGLAGKLDTGYVYAETDPVFLAHLAHSLTGTDTSHWNTAYRWGNHASAGYLTSFTELDPVFLAHLAHSLTGTDTSHWNTAYRWGDHSAAGYLTSFSELDPVFLAHLAHSLTGTDTSHWNTAYSWGNHAGLYAPLSHTHAASDITSGTLGTARLGSGTANSTKYLAGDGTWTTFPTVPSVTPAALTKTDDTNVTITLGGTPSTALLEAVNITLGWAGTLADPRIASAANWNGKADTSRHGSRNLLIDFNTSSTTAVNTNLTFPIGANETYTVDIYGTASKATSSTGLKIAIDGPSGCTANGFVETSSNAITTRLVYVISAISTLGTAFSTNVALVVPFSVHVTVINGATPGNITLQGATVTSNTATIYAGTYMRWTKSYGL